MFKGFRDLFEGVLVEGGGRSNLREKELRVACGALLVHCARADGEQSDVETAKLREILAERYALSDGETDALIEAAEAREADTMDVQKLTWLLHQNLDRPGRIEMVRLLWEVANADQNIDFDERGAVNLIAKLLDVELAEAVALRQHVERGARG